MPHKKMVKFVHSQRCQFIDMQIGLTVVPARPLHLSSMASNDWTIGMCSWGMGSFWTGAGLGDCMYWLIRKLHCTPNDNWSFMLYLSLCCRGYSLSSWILRGGWSLWLWLWVWLWHRLYRIHHGCHDGSRWSNRLSRSLYNKKIKHSHM